MREYTLIRSKRKTLSLQIGNGGELIARAPRWMPIFAIETFICAKSTWIERHQKTIQEKKEKIKEYSEIEIRDMKDTLKEYLISRVEELWKDTGLPKYTSLKVTKSERRWGSCSGKNGLCFSYRLAEYREKNPLFIDAIIYHELAHLREKNHGKKFWTLVYSLMPEYENIMKSHRGSAD